MKLYDVAIIGAGIVGTTVARQLSRYHLDILILEKDIDVAMGATKANSAIVHGGYAEPHTTLKGQLCYAGRQAFAALDAELNFGYRETGSLVVTTEDDPTPLRNLLEQGRTNGLSDLRLVSQEELRELEPELSRELKWGLLCGGAGVCSPYEMAIAMAENAITNGADLKLESQVTGIFGQRGDFTIEATTGSYRARSSTDDFIIEETKAPGFIQVAGIQSPGLTASPAIAQMVEGILKRSGLSLEPDSSFEPYRRPIIRHKELRPLREIKPLLDIPFIPLMLVLISSIVE